MMALLFASSTVPPEGFNSFLASAFYAVGLVTALLVLWKQLFPAKVPQPFMTKEQDVLVTKQECAVSHGHIHSRVLTLETRMDRVERKMEADKVEIIHATVGLSDKINARIDAVKDSIAERLAKVDERSASTQSDLRLLRQDLQDFFTATNSHRREA